MVYRKISTMLGELEMNTLRRKDLTVEELLKELERDIDCKVHYCVKCGTAFIVEPSDRTHQSETHCIDHAGISKSFSNHYRYKVEKDG